MSPEPDSEEEDEFTLEDILSAFHLDNGTLKRMMARMNRQMTNGLIGGLKTSTIAMLPSFVPILPDGSESGSYLAMDLGGTNLRVMLMVLERGMEPQTEQRNYRIPNSAMTSTGKQMIIDTEWCGFADKNEAEYIKTEFDRIVDARSVHPGVQFDESGYYNQTRIILDELCVDDYTFSDILLLREVCMAVSRRSANLAAAAIACVINRIGKKRITIGIDGSTYKYHPFYHFWIKDKIRELIPNDVEYQLVQAGDGSGKGAALVAALADKMTPKAAENQQNMTMQNGVLFQQIVENGPIQELVENGPS